MMKFEEGDLVRIVTPKEYRDRGGSCTSDCAIACYAGSLCTVEKVVIPGYKLIPEHIVMNFPRTDSHSIMPIEEYSWHEQTLDLCENDTALDDGGFDDVF
jgi:hypothetical protein